MAERIVPIAKPRARRAKKKCPICGRVPEAAHAPFCSRRCADEDLRRWLSGEYRVPTQDLAEPDDERS